MIWLLIILFLIGVSFGCVISNATNRKKPVGNLRIDKSDPDDGPYLFLELETDPQILEKEEYVTLKIVAKNYISQ